MIFVLTEVEDYEYEKVIGAWTDSREAVQALLDAPSRQPLYNGRPDRWCLQAFRGHDAGPEIYLADRTLNFVKGIQSGLKVWYDKTRRDPVEVADPFAFDWEANWPEKEAIA